MRRLPLLSILLLAACTSQVATNPTNIPEPTAGDHPPAVFTPATPTSVEEQPTTTVLVEEHPDRMEVLEARVTATTIVEEETTTTTAAPAKTTTTVAPTTAPPAPAPTPETTEPPGGFSSAKEGDFAARINGLRQSNGVAKLSRNGNLDGYARSWAKELAKAGKLSHSNFGSLLGTWSTVGENVGYGGSVDQVFMALVNSGGHFANMVAPEFTHFGVGVYVDSKGVVWTAHVFAG